MLSDKESKGQHFLSSIRAVLTTDDDSEQAPSIRQRAIWFFVILIVLLFNALAILFFELQRHSAHLDAERQLSRQRSLASLTTMRSDHITALVADYGYWGNLADFVLRPDSSWAAANIDPTLKNFDYETLLILDKQRTVVYQKSAFDTLKIAPPSIPDWSLSVWGEHHNAIHFSTNDGPHIREFAVSPIRRHYPETKADSILGYFVAAREWDDDELGLIDSLTEGICSLTSDTSKLPIPPEGSVRTLVPLAGLDGKPAAWIVNDFRSTVLASMVESQKLTVAILAVIMLIALVGGWWLIRQWFLKPLDLLQFALEKKNPSLLVESQGHPKEITTFLKLLMEVLSNQAYLEIEVRQRQLAEAEAISQGRNLKEAVAERDFVLEQAHVALFRLDRDGHFNYLSPGIKRITGYEPGELYRHYQFLITDDPMNMDGIRKSEDALSTGMPQEPYVVQMKRKDGSIGYAEIAEVPVVEDGGGYSIVGICRDVTGEFTMRLERDRLAASAEKNKRMESLVVLAGGVAHDLNNTLGPLVGYPALLREQLSDNPKGLRYLATMEQAARQAAEVVKDLLTLARRGRLILEPARCSEIMQTAIGSTAIRDRLAQRPEIRLITTFPDHEPQVLASASHLCRSVENLVINAIEAIPGSGTVSVRVSTREDTYLNPASQSEQKRTAVVMTVEDTGTGITEEDLTRIFDPYYSTKSMGRSGSGLGLALVYGIVRDHGGYHEISSELGKGTIISLVIPASPVHDAPARIPRNDRAKTAHILVVDDNQLQRDLLEQLLDYRGHTVATAGSSEEALSVFKDQHFDLVLLDMILEDGTDGTELYERMLKIRSPLSCVIVTGFGPGDRIDKALKLGAHKVLPKPFTSAQLDETVRSALESAVNDPAARQLVSR